MCLHCVVVVDLIRYVEPPCARLQFFGEGKTAMNHGITVCADPTVASNVGAQCCAATDDKEVCPDAGEWMVKNNQYGVDEYERHTGQATHGDLCRFSTGGWTCPVGCKRTEDGRAPYCVFDSGDFTTPCHLDLGVVSSGGGECLYVAEPMKYATAERRCAAEYEDGGLCAKSKTKLGASSFDGTSKDWQATCAGFMLSWANDPCTLKVQIFQNGDVAVVDRKNTIGFLKVNAANKFNVQWGDAPAGEANPFPTFGQNCTNGCTPMADWGGTCVCDLAVEDEPVIMLDDSMQLPTESELRAQLKIGAFDPAMYKGSDEGGYTLCTSKQCKSRSGIEVYTRGNSATPTSFGADTIFKFKNTAHSERPSSLYPNRFLLNSASVVHVGHTAEYQMLEPTAGIALTCTGSSSDHSENYVCQRAVDGNYHTEWATKQEQVGSWIEIAFDNGEETIDRMVFSNRCNGNERSKVVQLTFSDGNSRNVTLSDHCSNTLFSLDPPITTSTVKITVLSAHVAKTWANNGAREIGFLPVGKASTASVTPCEDAGLLPLSQTECEFAASHVQLPPGKVVGRSGSNSVGAWGHVPQKCSLYASDLAPKEADFSPHWNERESPQNWQDRFWPLCKVNANNAPNKTKTGFQFRNPPHFMQNTGEQAWMQGEFAHYKNPYGDSDHLLATAEHETEALLDHLFEHKNTAPFVAFRMIQRLVGSNPTPRFVKAAATAFRTGEYGGTTYSGKYGDMAAMTAAIMLDPEARATILDADTAHGQLREPVLKIMHLLRSLEYTSNRDMEVNLYKVGEKVGQFAFQSPSVFNFYLPEFSPAGPVQEAGLVAPEAQIATAPYLIGYLNGVSSLIDNGLTSCNRGFGDGRGQVTGGRYCHLGRGGDGLVRRSDGVLAYTPTDPTHPANVVDEMAMLLTGGRLGKKTRQVLTHVYESYVHEQAFDMAAGVQQSFAALDEYAVPEEECLYAAQRVLEIPVPVAATCEASSEYDVRYPCTKALDDNIWTDWATRKEYEGPPSGSLSTAEAECLVQVKNALPEGVVQGRLHLSRGTWSHIPVGCSYKSGDDNGAYWNNHAVGKDHGDFTSVDVDPDLHLGIWINVAFEAGATVIDRMAYKQRAGTEKNKDVLLEFSDGSSQTVTLWNNDSRAIFQLTPVNTSSVTIRVKSAYNSAGNNGAREIHFYQPGGAAFDIQGREYLSVGEWAHVPRGCSYQSDGDFAVHFNKHATGCNGPNCGSYTSVLAAGSENVFMPTQSTIMQFGPFEAVDGKTGYEFNHWGSLSCVHTKTENSPWYQIDLGSVQNITTVVYHARRCGGDCNTQTHGFDVYVDNTRIATKVEPKVGEVLRFEAYQMGRVVKIMNPGAAKVVTFCELEVNVAQAPNEEGRYLSRPDAEAKALKQTLKLITISPDFHATNFHTTKPAARAPQPPQVSKGRKYKAVVVVFLAGGADSFNVVVPHGGDAATSDCKRPIKDGAARSRKAEVYEEHDFYSEYQTERGVTQALTKASLLRVEVPGNDQPCKTFGLHPSFKRIQGLYNDGDAALLANLGGLVEPLTLQEWKDRGKANAKKLPPGVFAHNQMQKNAWTVHAEVCEVTARECVSTPRPPS